MVRQPRVLLVAVGGYGGLYLEEMLRHDTGARIEGIVETMPDVKAKIPSIEEAHIPLYQSLEAFYAEHEADLAVICAPIHLHTAMSLYCLQHGSNVLCEKPLCLTQEEASQLQACARQMGRFLSVGYQLNYRRDVLALKADILAGRFGAPRRLRIVHAVRRGDRYYARNNWAGHIRVNGHEVFDSPLNNACAHNFQLATFLLGKDLNAACAVTDVKAELQRGNPRVENFDIAALRAQTDCGAPILYYTAHPLKTKSLGPLARFEFEHATITYDEREQYVVTMSDGSIRDYSHIAPTAYFQKLYDAIACTREGGSPICGVPAQFAHIRAVRLCQEKPVRDVAPAHVDVVHVDGDVFHHVHGLEETFLKAADAWALPEEIGLG